MRRLSIIPFALALCFLVTVGRMFADTPLVITKSASPDPVLPGQNLTYILTVTNTGQTALSGVVVTDTTPVNTVFDSAGYYDGSWIVWVPSQGQPGTVRWESQAAIPAGEGQRLQLVVTVDEGVWGTITNDQYNAGDGNGEVQGQPVAVGVDAPTPTPLPMLPGGTSEVLASAGEIANNLSPVVIIIGGLALGLAIAIRMVAVIMMD